MGRPSKYEQFVKPYIADVEKWVQSGATDKEIAKALGIAVSTLCDYKNKYSEFSAAFVRGRANVVIEIKAALLKKALGFNYQEQKVYVKKDEEGEAITYIETTTKYSPPSETAGAMLLRNYTDDWQDKDSITTRLKQQEQELKRAIAEANNFDLNLTNKN